MAAFLFYAMLIGSSVLLGLAIHWNSWQNWSCLLLLQYRGDMSLDTSWSLSFRAISKFYTSASSWPPCLLPVKGTRVIRLLGLRIWKSSLYLLPFLRWSQRKSKRASASWPVLKVVLLLGLPRCFVQPRKPVLFAARSSNELLWWVYSSVDPTALLFWAGARVQFFSPWDTCEFQSGDD